MKWPGVVAYRHRQADNADVATTIICTHVLTADGRTSFVQALPPGQVAAGFVSRLISLRRLLK